MWFGCREDMVAAIPSLPETQEKYICLWVTQRSESVVLLQKRIEERLESQHKSTIGGTNKRTYQTEDRASYLLSGGIPLYKNKRKNSKKNEESRFEALQFCHQLSQFGNAV